MAKKVIFCTPSLSGPTKPYIASLEASLPLIEAAGWEHGYAQQIACPYISAARANMTRAALDSLRGVEKGCIVYLDYDLSWRPEDLLKLIETEGDCIAGTYRAKIDDEQYMGTIETHANHAPKVRESDGAIEAKMVPAGFLRLTLEAIDTFMLNYPEHCYGPQYHMSVDLFNHGVEERVWWGEDYMFSRRFRAKCGPIWLVPDLSINHYHMDYGSGEELKVYKGNFHEFMLRQPGGSKDPNRKAA